MPIHKPRAVSGGSRVRPSAWAPPSDPQRELAEHSSYCWCSFRFESDAPRLEWVSGPVARLTGYSEDELLALDDLRLLVHADQVPAPADALDHLRRGEPIAGVWGGRRKDGASFEIQYRARPIWDAQHAVVIGIFGAVYEDDDAEQPFAGDYEYLLRVDTVGSMTIEWATVGFTRLTGYTPAELDAQGSVVALGHPDDRSAYDAAVRALANFEPLTFDARIVTKSGETRWMRRHMRRMDRDGVERIRVTAQDITELHRAEEERRRGPARALTAREHEVLRGIVAGKRLKQLAAELGVSEKTVTSHRRNMLDKLGLESNAELVRHAIRREIGYD